MNKKAITIISTIAVFLLTVIAAFVWLSRTRYADVTVIGGEIESPVEGRDYYEYVNSRVSGRFIGKSVFEIKKSEAEKLFSSDPRVKIVSVKKVFPNRIKLNAEIRSPEFVLRADCYEYDYVVDDEFFVIGRFAKSKENAGDLPVVNINGCLPDKTPELSEKIRGDVISLLEVAFANYDVYDDPTLVASVTLNGGTNKFVEFGMATGVRIKFVLGVSKFTDKEFLSAKNEFCLNAVNASDAYFGLSDSEKNEGTLWIIKDINGEIVPRWEKTNQGE